MTIDFRQWLVDSELRDSLLRLYRKEDGEPSGSILTQLKASGLLDTDIDGTYRLSRQGTLLAYNIAEFMIQIENRNIFSVLEQLNILPGEVVLDVGCGAGQTLFALADKEPSLALGMDADRAHLKIAQSFASHFPLSHGRFAFQQGDGSSLPFKNASIDVLIYRGVLHYLDIHQAFQEIARVLRPGGRIFIHALGIRFFTTKVVESELARKLFGLFVILNGIFHVLTGRQLTVKYRNHRVRAVFLTIKSLQRLERFGITLRSLEFKSPGYYIVIGEKS